jgi:hypothetical protein
MSGGKVVKVSGSRTEDGVKEVEKVKKVEKVEEVMRKRWVGWGDDTQERSRECTDEDFENYLLCR